MATRIHRPLGANGVGKQRFELTEQL